MIVQDDSDVAFREILRIKVGEETYELDAAVAIFHARRDVTIREVQAARRLALRGVVDRVYALHSGLAHKQDSGRCARCQSRRPLQIHHLKYRSHGSTHPVENIERYGDLADAPDEKIHSFAT